MTSISNVHFQPLLPFGVYDSIFVCLVGLLRASLHWDHKYTKKYHCKCQVKVYAWHASAAHLGRLHIHQVVRKSQINGSRKAVKWLFNDSSTQESIQIECTGRAMEYEPEPRQSLPVIWSPIVLFEVWSKCMSHLRGCTSQADKVACLVLMCVDARPRPNFDEV